MPEREKMLVQQGIRQLFSAGKDRKATGILVDRIMLVSPGADRKSMLSGRQFDKSGKFVTCWFPELQQDQQAVSIIRGAGLQWGSALE